MTSAQDRPLTAALADFASSASLEILPAPVLDRSSALLAAILEAARAQLAPGPLASVLSSLDSPPECTVFGSREKLGGTYAAFLNGSAAHRSPVGGAFSAERAAEAVVPACVAAAEIGRRSGADLLFGVAVGLECALRLAAKLGPGHEARGFQLLGSAGRLGAALGASRTLGHDLPQTIAAIGFASTESGGPLRAAAQGGAALLSGKAAADGLEAALLAGAGLIGPSAPIEGRRGLFALEAADGAMDPLADLGTVWLLADEPLVGAPEPLVVAALALVEDPSVYGLLEVIGGH